MVSIIRSLELRISQSLVPEAAGAPYRLFMSGFKGTCFRFWGFASGSFANDAQQRC